MPLEEHGTWKPEEQASTRLGSYYRMVKASDQLTELEWDAANEASIEAIAAAGFDQDDSDRVGAPMGEDVQALLTLAFVRCPELMEHFGAMAEPGYEPYVPDGND